MNQAVVNPYAYDPFGQVLNQQETIPQPFKYAVKCIATVIGEERHYVLEGAAHKMVWQFGKKALHMQGGFQPHMAVTKLFNFL